LYKRTIASAKQSNLVDHYKAFFLGLLRVMCSLNKLLDPQRHGHLLGALFVAIGKGLEVEGLEFDLLFFDATSDISFASLA
jgi:hypothetical protein